jgi:diguanylate cyclase (GGDEF)-like protein
MQPVFSEKEKRQRKVILITLPVGAVLASLLTFDLFGKGEFLGSIASALFSVSVIILCGVVYFYQRLVREVELVFFYSTAFYLCLMTIHNINMFSGGRTEDFFTSNLSAIVLWIAIVYMASYMALTSRQNSIFMSVSLGSLFFALLYHMLFRDGFHLSIILLWVRELFALFVLTMLITQTGKLYKDYITKDDLTGAYNRREVYHVLHREMERSARQRKSFSIILFDVDHFKNINDTYGHIAGDNVLKEISRSVNKLIRQVDYLGRWGGEEFLIVLPDTDIQSAERLAERLCDAIRQIHFEGLRQVTASFGITVYQYGQVLEEMLHAADVAMYQAKQNGRDRVFVFQEEIDYEKI